VEATRALVELLPDGEGDRAAELLQAAADAAEALGEDEDAAALRRRAAGCRAGAEAATEAAAVAWERRLEQEPGCDEALEALDNLYERLGRSARRREVLVSRLRRADAGLPVRRALARLELDLGDATAAVRLIEDPPEGTDPATLRLLARAAAAAGDEEAAALALETLARRITDPAERSRLYLRAAETYREVLGDVPVVLENAMLAFMCDRDHEEAFRTLARLYEQAERWREVVGICDLSLARARDGGPYEPAVLLRRRGRVEARHLDRPREAVATLLEALAVAPEDEETLGALDTLITATGDHAARRRMGELLAECGPAEGRRGALLLAAEGATMAGDRRGAVALLERALSRLPDDGEVADRLAEAYAELEDWPRLADLHLALTEGTPAAEQERAALLDAARVLEDRLSDLPGALLALERAVAAAPEDGELLDELAGRLEAAGHWDRMLAVTEHQWELAETDEQRALVRVRQGAVRRAGEDDRAGAEAAWREALEFDTGCLAALHALRELFSDGEDWDRLLEVLEAEVEVLRDDGARAEVLYRLGEVHLEGRRDPSAAAEAWRRALAAAPEHELSVRQLLYLLLAQRAWDEAAPLAEALVRLTAGAEDPQEPCHAWTLRARVALAQGQGNLAAEALVAALGVDPGSEPAQRVLAELVSSPAAGEVPAAQLDALEATLQGAGQRGQASMHLLRGRVAESELQTEEALERYRRSVEADPTSSGARRAWAGLLGRLRRWREAADVLAEAPELAAERGEWLLLQVEAADLRMERLEDVEGAVDTYAGVAEALSPPPDDERADREPPQTRSATAVSQAEALLRRALFGQAQGQRQLGRFEEAVTTVRRLCRLEEAHPVGAHGPASLGRYRHFLGRLYEEGLEDDEAARAAFCRGVEAAPGDPVCAIGLARFLARSDTDAADEALQEAIRAAEGEEGGPGGASAQRLVCYRARLWECAGDPQGAADLLMDAAGTAVDPVGPRKALAALYLRSFEHGVAFALSAYHEILRSDPASTDALRGLLDVYERTEQPDKLFHARAIHGLLSARAPEPEESAAREVSERLAGSAELEMGLVEQLLLHRQAKSPIWALWPVAAGYLALVYPVAPPADPGTRRVWPDQSDHPLSEALAGLRSFLGAELVDGLEVHVGPGRRGVVGYPGSPPALWVGEDVVFGETAPGALRFLLARAAVLLRDGRGLALVEDADAGISAVRSVAALFHAAVGSEPPGGGLPADLPRGLVRAARAALAGDTTFAEAEPDPEAYVEGVRRTADRVGLLACGDPVLALRVLVGRDAAVPDRCAQALRSQPDAAALVRFVVSEEHFAARQALGVALPRDEG